MNYKCLTATAVLLLFVNGASAAGNPGPASGTEAGLSDGWLELAYGVGFGGTGTGGEIREKTKWGARASGSLNFGPSLFFAGSYEQQNFNSSDYDFLGTYYETTVNLFTGKEGFGTRFGSRDHVQGVLLVTYQEHQYQLRELADGVESTDAHASRGLGYSLGFRTFLIPRLEFAGGYEHAPLKGKVAAGNFKQIFETSWLSLSAPLSQHASLVMRLEQVARTNKADGGSVHLQSDNFLLGLRYTL